LHDPEFKLDAYDTDTTWGPYSVEFAEDTAKNDMSGGYPQLRDITYGDLDHDGSDEAVIDFATGGSAGVCSYGVMKRIGGKIRMIAFDGMYKGYASIENDTLWVTSSLYTPTEWEGNSYPLSHSIEGYLLRKGKLLRVDSTAEGTPDGAWATVQSYYDAITEKDYLKAYKLFLGSKYKKKHPYKEWVKGFVDSDSVEVNVEVEKSRPLNTTKDGTVPVTIIVHHASGTITKYTGIWKLKWTNSDDGWQMAESNIKEVR
jgi:hypothetical protein